MKALFISWLTLQCITAFSQNHVDSLKRGLVVTDKLQQNPEQLAAVYEKIAWSYYQQGNLDSALRNYSNAVGALKHSNDQELLAHGFLGLSVVYLQRGRFDSSIYFCQSALPHFTALMDTTHVQIVISNLAVAYKNSGLYAEALDVSLKLLDLVGENAHSELAGSTHNNIGSIYTRTGSFEDGLKHYRTALVNRALRKKPSELSKIYNNIGELFTQTHRYDSAIQNFQVSIALKRQAKDQKGLARTLGNLARVLIRLNLIEAAKTALEEAESLQRAIEDPIGRIEVLHHRAEWHSHRFEFDAAKRNLQLAYRLIKLHATPQHLRTNLERQIEIDQAVHDTHASIKHLTELLVIRDSLLNIDKSRSLHALRIKYETERRENEIATLRQRQQITDSQLQKNQILNWALSVGFLLVGALAALIYVNWRNARHAEARISLLLFETRHRIRNHLQTLVSIFSLQSHQSKNTDLSFEASQSESRIHAMSLLHEKLSSASSSENIDAKEYVTDLVKTLSDIYGDRVKKLTVTVDAVQILVPADTAMALGLIIHELFCNAIKYAFPSHPSPLVSITTNLIDGITFILTVRDNGRGIISQNARKNHGLSLIITLVEQLAGTYEVLTEKGTTFKITFTIQPIWKKH